MTVSVAATIDRPKSVRKRCVIDRFCSVFCSISFFTLCYSDFALYVLQGCFQYDCVISLSFSPFTCCSINHCRIAQILLRTRDEEIPLACNTIIYIIVFNPLSLICEIICVLLLFCNPINTITSHISVMKYKRTIRF